MIESPHVDFFFTPPITILYIPNKLIRCVKAENCAHNDANNFRRFPGAAGKQWNIAAEQKGYMSGWLVGLILAKCRVL